VSTFGTQKSFRLGSLFDPDFSLGGQQPYGFDQVKVFYDRYLVRETIVRATFYDPSADGIVCAMGAQNFYDPNTIVGASIDWISERLNHKTEPISNTGSQRIVMVDNWKHSKLMGLTSHQFDGAFMTLGARINADPAETPYLNFAIADSRAESTAKTIRCRVEIFFYVQFFNRINVPQS
jgi:hypothetical protein